jgi:hypothetical protein
MEVTMSTKFRIPLLVFIAAALLVTLFALSQRYGDNVGLNTNPVEAAREFKPAVYDATGVMFEAITADNNPVQKYQVHDATGVMLDAISAKPAPASNGAFYDATAAMLAAITPKATPQYKPYVYDATGIMLSNIVLP